MHLLHYWNANPIGNLISLWVGVWTDVNISDNVKICYVGVGVDTINY